ncbi:GNAT family N-acetyltransferase [Paenibacillus selenitireducens]|uniref:GNAT family N-acetyltransferase n=1 Tax=Paenibacillus selenitireducens TaxID=1324314 RepID=A0A1T2XHT7_9BACL|nr:GNAT family N-acetyltransferase [Paenibacillus selenitireducens]OPA79430.1 GNAT family N-acetyltransferase [Paenibacillus selenitireducens]
MKIHRKQTLSEQELQDIRELADICNLLDGIQLKLNWVSLQTRSGEETNDFLIYNDAGDLIGYLGMYVFRSSEAEISGMVHPRYRRQGLFRKLVDAALTECRQREFPKVLFICHHASASGKAFLIEAGTTYTMSEHWMRCEWADVTNVERSAALAMEIRAADVEDTEVLVSLNQDGFDMTEEDSREYVERCFGSPLEYTFIAELEGQPIGKLGVTYEDGAAFIYGFCVQPTLRGKGYGRAILRGLIEQLNRERSISRFELEVAVKNERALGIYESCGFRVVSANDYYVLTV